MDITLRKFDIFAAANVGFTNIWREGLVSNGRFPDNSKGNSEKQKFTTYGIKAGTTYKLNGRNYLYANAGYMTQAPLVRDIFQSTRTRNTTIPNLTTEKTLSPEVLYIASSKVKARVSAYYTQL
ncbi:hypothetical protein MASR1M65_15070 [Saprospiraceae bacterium]